MATGFNVPLLVLCATSSSLFHNMSSCKHFLKLTCWPLLLKCQPPSPPSHQGPGDKCHLLCPGDMLKSLQMDMLHAYCKNIPHEIMTILHSYNHNNHPKTITFYVTCFIHLQILSVHSNFGQALHSLLLSLSVMPSVNFNNGNSKSLAQFFFFFFF